MKPLGTAYGDAKSVGYELLHGQVTRAQGIFSPRAVHKQFSLDYIAENLENPVAVLHYPSKAEFIRELKKGYDYVGLSFIMVTYHHMREMALLARVQLRSATPKASAMMRRDVQKLQALIARRPGSFVVV